MLQILNLEVCLVRTNKLFQLEVDPSITLGDLFDTVQEWTNIPIEQPLFEIVNPYKIITDLKQEFGKLGLQIGKQIQINIYSQDEYNEKKNQITMIFEILDRKEKCIQTIKLNLNQTLNDAKDILLKQCGFTEEQREAVDIVFYQQNSDNFFNPKKLNIQLHLLQFNNNDKMTCRLKYIGGHNL